MAGRFCITTLRMSLSMASSDLLSRLRPRKETRNSLSFSVGSFLAMAQPSIREGNSSSDQPLSCRAAGPLPAAGREGLLGDQRHVPRIAIGDDLGAAPAGFPSLLLPPAARGT